MITFFKTILTTRLSLFPIFLDNFIALICTALSQEYILMASEFHSTRHEELFDTAMSRWTFNILVSRVAQEKCL